MDRGAWQATVHGLKSQTQLSDKTTTTAVVKQSHVFHSRLIFEKQHPLSLETQQTPFSSALRMPPSLGPVSQKAGLMGRTLDLESQDPWLEPWAHHCIHSDVNLTKLKATKNSRIHQQSPKFCSVQFVSVAQSCPTLCDPMVCSTPGFPAHHQVSELAQTHVHWVRDTIQPSHTLSSPSPPTFNLSQHQGLFQWDSSSHQVAKVFEFQLQHQSFQWIFRTDFLDGLVGSPCRSNCKQKLDLQKRRLSRVFSNTTIQKHQFFSAQLSL